MAIVGYDPTTAQITQRAVLTDAQKCGGIFSLHYAENTLYAGCSSSIVVWSLDISANVCNPKEIIKTQEPGIVIGLSRQQNMLVYAQHEGSYVALDLDQGNTPLWTYFEKEVLGISRRRELLL